MANRQQSRENDRPGDIGGNFLAQGGVGRPAEDRPPLYSLPRMGFCTPRPPHPARRSFLWRVCPPAGQKTGKVGWLGSLGATVPIYELLRRQGSFEPEEVTVLCNVFDEVLQKLGLVDRKDPVTEMVAKKLIELAKAGMRDPVRLKALTLQAFTQQQQQQIQGKRGKRARRPAR